MRIIIDKNGQSEAICTATFFLDNYKTFSTLGLCASIDIGGGTTDITFWENGVMSWEDSVKFAGGDLTGMMMVDLMNLFSPEEKESLNMAGDKNQYEDTMRWWPFVHPSWDNKMEAFYQHKNVSQKILRTLALFYGGICFYLGLHLRKHKVEGDLNLIALAGNGVRFLELVSYGVPLDESNSADWLNLFRSCLLRGQGKPSFSSQPSFLFSNAPKLEVAKGLVSANINRFTTDRNADDDQKSQSRSTQRVHTEKILGLDIKQSGSIYDYGSWPNDFNALQLANCGVDLTILKEFLSCYDSYVRKNFKNWKSIEMVEQDEKEVKSAISRSLTLRGPQELASAIFFEALNAWMTIQYER